MPQKNGEEMNKTLKTFILIFAAGLAIRIFATFIIPCDTDESSYFFDSKYLLEGVLPVRAHLLSAFLVPFTYLAPSILAMRLLPVIASSLTIIFVFLIGRRLYGDKGGLISATIFALVPFNIFYGSMLFTEPLQWLFLSAALYFFTYGYQKNNLWALFANGVLIGLAFGVRETSVVVGAAEVLFLAYTSRKKILESLEPISAIGVGAVPALFYFFMLPRMSYAYTGTSLLLNKLGIGFFFILEGAPLVLIAGLFLYFALRKKEFVRDNAFIVILFGALGAFYILFSKWHLHYFYEFALVISLMGAALLQKVNRKIILGIVLCSVFSLGIFCAFQGFENWYPQKDLNDAADYLKEISTPGEEAFTANLAVLYLAGLRPVANITHPAVYAIPAKEEACSGCTIAGDADNRSGSTVSEDAKFISSDAGAIMSVGYMLPDALIEYMEASRTRFAIVDEWTRHCYFEKNPLLEKYYKDFFWSVRKFGGIEIWVRS